MSVVAYRLLREVRAAGDISWAAAECRVQDPDALDSAVEWLHDRGLVAIDQAGIHQA